MIRRVIPDCWAATENARVPKANLRNQMMTSGRSQMLATRNFGDLHTVVGEVPWSSMPKTTMDCHSKLVLHSLRNNQPLQIVMHQPKQTTLILSGSCVCDQTCCSILNMLQLVHDLLRHGNKTELQQSTSDMKKARTNVFTNSMSSERRTRLNCRSQKKLVLQIFDDLKHARQLVKTCQGQCMLKYVTIIAVFVYEVMFKVVGGCFIQRRGASSSSKGSGIR